VVAATWTALFVRSWRSLAAVPKLVPRGPSRPASVTAFVPARDEAEVIERSIAALLAEGGAIERIIAVDDGSTDATGAILSRLAESSAGRLATRIGRGPAEGECGKPAALASAVEGEAPRSEWLLFVDADVVLRPGAIGALLDLAEEERADLVSIVPRVEMKGALENLAMPAVGALVLAQYPPERVRDPSRPLAFANGQLILVRRTTYEAAGGHRAVASEILEDVRLSERIKRIGGRIAIADGAQIASTRMYARWSEIVEGWSKNLFLLFGESPARAIGWASLAIVLSWIAPVVVFADFPQGIAAYGLVLAYQMILRRKGGAPALWAILAPISAVLASSLLLRSTLLYMTGRAITWKGRSYSPKRAG
jgi:glycosyltransferase involved in cell wall biosynthesis